MADACFLGGSISPNLSDGPSFTKIGSVSESAMAALAKVRLPGKKFRAVDGD